MTYDEWKKTRVEAGAEALRSWTGWGEAGIEVIAKIDAVPLPETEELIKFFKDTLKGAWHMYEIDVHFNIPDKGADTLARILIDALRPWLATMIEKGK